MEKYASVLHSSPKADLPVGFTKLQIVHDQARLVAAIDIERCLGP